MFSGDFGFLENLGEDLKAVENLGTPGWEAPGTWWSSVFAVAVVTLSPLIPSPTVIFEC